MHIEEVKGNLCNLSYFFVKLNSVISQKKNLNSVVKEGLGAGCVTSLFVFVKIKQEDAMYNTHVKTQCFCLCQIEVT